MKYAVKIPEMQIPEVGTTIVKLNSEHLLCQYHI